jgi:hypothetical protein
VLVRWTAPLGLSETEEVVDSDDEDMVRQCKMQPVMKSQTWCHRSNVTYGNLRTNLAINIDACN